MSIPFTYSPNQHYSHIARAGSPFIPPSSPYASPYSNPAGLPPDPVYGAGQPPGYASWSGVRERRNSFNGAPAYPDPYEQQQMHTLQRRGSFNAGHVSPYMRSPSPNPYGASAGYGSSAPYGSSTSPYMGNSSPYGGSTYEPHTWSSYLAQQGIPYSNSPYRAPSPVPGYDQSSYYGNNAGYPSAYGAPTPNLIIHPYINADVPRPDFVFDLGVAQFSPQRQMGSYGGAMTAVTLSTEELQEFATHPPVMRLRIVSEGLPLWPIDLEYNPGSTGLGLSGMSSASASGDPPPITLGDVLVVLHQRLHERVSPAEWASQSPSQQQVVAKSYSRRCRNEERIMPGMGNEARQRADGVKRVDFLHGRTRLVGLKMVSEMERGVITMMLVTS
jgi:hypothetical protein